MTSRIKILLSDVDGTLVTRDKRLTAPTLEAVRRLAEHEIAFTIVSSRPPIGLEGVVAELGLRLPFGAFNGGTILDPDLSVVEGHFVPEHVARQAAAYLEGEGVSVWVFADNSWLVTDPDGHNVGGERRTIRHDPTVVTAFGDALARAGKIVGSCADHAKLSRCEAVLRERLGGAAVAARSQPYYLDVTPPGVDKGTFLDFLARHLGIAHEEIVAIGDMDNDVAMFRKAGLAIAMGNASDAARAAAGRGTTSNEEDGVAAAIERLLDGLADA